MFALRGYNLSAGKRGLLLVLALLSAPKAYAEADALMGTAAIIGAASSGVVAGIQAGADVAVTKTNADAQLKMTQITADNSKYLADSQERNSFFQTMMAQTINSQNNKAQTDRLMLMLQEQAAARNQQYQLKAEDRAEDYRFKMMQMQLAQKQSDDDYKLGLLKLEASKVQAGMSSGFKNVTSNLTSSGVNGGMTTLASNAGAKANLSTRPNASLATSTTSLRAMSPMRRRILASIGTKRIKPVEGNLLPYGALSQGSTRAARQKGNSDLMDFQNSIASAGTSVAANGYRHVSRVQDESSSSHSSGIRDGISRGRAFFQ